MVDSALRSSKRMSRLVGDLLLLARADAGRAGTHRPCDLAEIAGNVAVELAPLMGERELEIDNEHALPVSGNADELHRMVLNLLDNATRHTPPGARIELHVRRVGERGRGRGGRRRSRHPPDACASRSSTASSAARARPTPPSAPAAASASR